MRRLVRISQFTINKLCTLGWRAFFYPYPERIVPSMAIPSIRVVDITDAVNSAEWNEFQAVTFVKIAHFYNILVE